VASAIIILVMKVQIANLQPGDEVGIANCVTLGRVIRRAGKNLYIISWKGSELTLPRNQLLINREGRFVKY